MVRVFTEEPDGCRVAWLTRKENRERVLLTFLVVCDLNGELLPAALQTRVESGWVSTRCGQVHAGVRERTLRDGMRERAPAYGTREHRREDDGRGKNTHEGKKNVTVVPLAAVKLAGLYTRLPPAAT